MNKIGQNLKKEKPRFSVIIPVYNGERFISKAIESVLAQSYPAYEIIVVDDGSTDNTPQILERYKDKIIIKRIINDGKNSPANARNVAMRMMRGDWVAFLDADDIWFKDKLKKQVEAILSYPSVGFIGGEYITRLPITKFRLKKHSYFLHHLNKLNFDEPLEVDPFKMLIKENFIGAPLAVVIKKEIIDKVGEFRGSFFTENEDYDYWLRCATIADFLILKDALAYKKTHELNLTNDDIWFYMRHINALENIMKEGCCHTKDLIWQCRSALSLNRYCLGNSYFEAGKIRQAFYAYWQGVLTHKTFNNFVLFFWSVFKKTIRLLTFNIIRRGRFNALTSLNRRKKDE